MPLPGVKWSGNASQTLASGSFPLSNVLSFPALSGLSSFPALFISFCAQPAWQPPSGGGPVIHALITFADATTANVAGALPGNIVAGHFGLIDSRISQGGTISLVVASGSTTITGASPFVIAAMIADGFWTSTAAIAGGAGANPVSPTFNVQFPPTDPVGTFEIFTSSGYVFNVASARGPFQVTLPDANWETEQNVSFGPVSHGGFNYETQTAIWVYIQESPFAQPSCTGPSGIQAERFGQFSISPSSVPSGGGRSWAAVIGD